MAIKHTWNKAILVLTPIHGEPAFTSDGTYLRFKAHERNVKYVSHHAETGAVIIAENENHRDLIHNDLMHDDELSNTVIAKIADKMKGKPITETGDDD